MSDSNDPNSGGSVAYLELTAAEFDALSAPTSDDTRTMIRVLDDTDRAGALAYGRKDINGDEEWFVNADSFQIPVETTRTFTDLDATGVSYGSAVAFADLTDYSEVRFGLRVTVAGNTGRAMLTYDNGDGEADLATNYVLLGTTGYKMSEWEPVPSGARVPCAVKVKGYNGDTAEDPQIINCIAHFRR